MTDKQIIIDVSDCSELCGTKCHILMSCTNTSKSDSCSEMPNCYYKQLKRKEQKCEELKEEIKNHNDDMFKNPPEKRFYCKGCTLPYISKKLKQTLTEIKKIAEDESYIGFWDEQISKILQKISEVLE